MTEKREKCNHVFDLTGVHCISCKCSKKEIELEERIEELEKKYSNEAWRSKVNKNDLADFIDKIEKNWNELEKKIGKLEQKLEIYVKEQNRLRNRFEIRLPDHMMTNATDYAIKNRERFNGFQQLLDDILLKLDGMRVNKEHFEHCFRRIKKLEQHFDKLKQLIPIQWKQEDLVFETWKLKSVLKRFLEVMKIYSCEEISEKIPNFLKELLGEQSGVDESHLCDTEEQPIWALSNPTDSKPNDILPDWDGISIYDNCISQKMIREFIKDFDLDFLLQMCKIALEKMGRPIDYSRYEKIKKNKEKWEAKLK